MDNNVTFWTSVTVVKMSYYAAFTDCKEKDSEVVSVLLHAATGLLKIMQEDD